MDVKKMNKSLKIFFACMLGAGLGALIAFEIHQYFWWLGILAGGLAGYLSYEFKKVLNAILCVWNSVVNWKPKIDWKLFFLRLKEFSCFFGAFFCAVFSFVSGICIAILIFACLISGIGVIQVSLMQSLSLGCLVVSLYSSFVLSFILLIHKDLPITETSLKIFQKINPITIWFYYPFYYFCCFIENLPNILNKFYRFITKVFILIHSEVRLLCGVDAMIGAGIGFFSGSILIGMIAGGLIGILNYEIISKKILKLAKTK